MLAREFLITGHVQGVYFRAECKRAAEDFGVFGWVANNGDGSVTVHAEGSEQRIEDLFEWCRHGPSGAQVETIQMKEAPPEEANSFEIVY